MDDGSETSFITEACATALGLPRSNANVQISGIGENISAHAKWSTTLRLESTHNDSFIDVPAFILGKVAGSMPRWHISSEEIDEWKHVAKLKLADSSFYRPGRIDILLGADAIALAVTQGIRRGLPHQPIATNTMFGWVIFGTFSPTKQDTRIIASHISKVSQRTVASKVDTRSTGDTLQDLVQKFWEVEQLPKRKVLTSSEIACENHFKATHKRLDTGRYQVKLPFNSTIHLSIEALGSTRQMAETRLRSLERRFKKYPNHHKAYIEFMREYLELGHMEPIAATKGISYYIPHHFVIKEDSTTTKLRVVFDASALSSTGTSLNKAMLVGPTIQEDLFSILLRFRMHPIALKADIAKMYRQFQVHPDDRTYQRILWRENPSDQIQEYQLTTVTYGTAAAPYLATRCLIQLAEDEFQQFPIAANIIKRDAYVDDLISGADSESSAISLAQSLISLTAKGEMNMRKWVSNSESVMNSIPSELRENAQSCTFDEDAAIKALGISWQPASDRFTFYTNTSSAVKTKRELLSEISKTFDPLGWLSPITIRGKILFQNLWQLEVGWDDPIPESIQQQWKSIQEELPKLSDLHIPRCIWPANCTDLELHAFSDASEQAYSACVYLKCKSNEKIQINLIAAKTKVAPLSQTSLPRLELCSSLLLAELLDSIISATQIKCKIYCHTDSMITLKWITSPSRQWKTFVANRVAAIQEIVPPERWQHVSGTDNPADLATRSETTVEQLLSSSLWWHGPWWLQYGTNAEATQELFPNQHVQIQSTEADADQVAKEERNIVHVNHANTTEENWIERFSSLSKLVATAAVFMRVKCILRKKSFIKHGIQAKERRQALLALVLQQQHTTFSSEMNALQKNKQLSLNNKLVSLAPYLDSEGMLRVGGRLQKAKKERLHAQHQLLLPKGHLTKLIIESAHKSNLHGGTTTTMASIRQEYWIVGARDYCQFIIRKCIICRKAKATLMQQQMGQLPAARVSPARPFLHSGVDFAGPFRMRTTQRRNCPIEKVYFAVFVCMATKAVHLEFVTSLSTDGFIASFRRFVSRRGICSHLYSDCGTNFIGAEKELHLQLKQAEQQYQQQLSQLGTEFHFNPPAAPHQGGLWEAAVKSTKHHLRRIMGPAILSLEQFVTLLANIEAVLNSRPLCTLSTDPTDMSALTPGHFLIGGPLNAVPDPNLTSISMNRLNRWQLVQQLTQHFWARWRAEYLTTLQQRQRWVRKRESIRIGDLVLLAEDNLPPALWKMGRVTEIYPGSDHLVRKAKVKFVSNSTTSPIRYAELVRPIQKLSLILSSNELE